MKTKITAVVLVSAVSVLAGCGVTKGSTVNADYDEPDPNCEYAVTAKDAKVTKAEKKATGEALMCGGWKVNIREMNQAKISTYRAQKKIPFVLCEWDPFCVI